MYKSFGFSAFPEGRLLLKKRCFTAGFQCFCRIKQLKKQSEIKTLYVKSVLKNATRSFRELRRFYDKN